MFTISHNAKFKNKRLYKQPDGTGPVAKWLGSQAPLQQPRVSPVWSHAEAASHMPQLEGPKLKIYNYVPGGFWEKKEK